MSGAAGARHNVFRGSSTFGYILAVVRDRRAGLVFPDPMKIRLATIILLLLAASRPAWPQVESGEAAEDFKFFHQEAPVVAVLGHVSGPYKAAFDAFTREFGSVATYRLAAGAPAIGPQTRVVVAFGGDAAERRYPREATVIACLAPGVPDSSSREGGFVFIAMKPPPGVLLARLRTLQPRLKRLAVLWDAAYTGEFLSELKVVAAKQGVEIDSVRVAGVAGVPNALRSLTPKPDALWLAPDPGLITPESFQTIKQYSWDNSIPFYAPTAGLAAAGADAAVSVSPEEMGRLAAELSRRALGGETLPQIAFSTKTVLTVNLRSAAKSGLKVPAAALAGADKVIP